MGVQYSPRGQRLPNDRMRVEILDGVLGENGESLWPGSVYSVSGNFGRELLVSVRARRAPEQEITNRDPEPEHAPAPEVQTAESAPAPRGRPSRPRNAP